MVALASAETAEIIDYASEQDWLAQYGKEPESDRSNTPWTTASDARSYYERVGKIDAATEAFAKEEGAPREPLASTAASRCSNACSKTFSNTI